jgi:uncharacterized protein (DUF1800 family)
LLIFAALALTSHPSLSALVLADSPTPVIAAVGTGQPLPLGIFTANITGTGFVSGSVVELNGTPLTTTYSDKDGSLTASGFYRQPGMAKFTVRNGSVVSAAFPVQIGVQNPKVSPAAARRFLEQAAFGPSPSDATHLQSIGIQAWLNEQFNSPQVSTYTYPDDRKLKVQPATRFLTNAVNNPDQLRQRVAFALSQIFVTSYEKIIFDHNMIPFQNMLLADSFTNYRKIMEDVTLSAAMGQYLDMANNGKADPATGTVANENYARELMQLFTLGPNLLNQDGSLQLDSSGQPIPTYSQFTVMEFARVYTGWTYAPNPQKGFRWPSGPLVTEGPMVSYKLEHDFGSKKLLNGYVSPAKVSPEQDLANALDNVFNHPNIGPFVGKLLIQHLVKSNPSPAYISRVAAVFNNNGHSVRGDMRATIAAVLLDPEARADDEGGKQQATDGHLQEPALFVAGMVRELGGHMTDQNSYRQDMVRLGEDLFDAPSVFNYYAPDYAVPNTPLTGGEFEINTPNTSIVRANMVGQLVLKNGTNPVQSASPGTNVDLSPFVALASNPPALVDALDLTFTHGVMPAAMKAVIVKAVKDDDGNGLHKVQTGCYLILTSSYYNVWH